MNFVKEIGTNLYLGGFILVGTDEPVLVMTPDAELYPSHPLDGFSYQQIQTFSPTSDEFQEIIRQMDLVEVEITDSKGEKVILRKTQRQGDQKVTWEVFRRDDYRCRYCGIEGGERGATLSYDHVKLWEEGGEWSIENGVTACTKCNRQRGNMDYAEWLASDIYLRKSVNVDPYFLEMNNQLREVYKTFPERASKRGRK